MIALLLIAIIVFALSQRRRYRRQLYGDRWTRKVERWQQRYRRFDGWGEGWQRWSHAAQTQTDSSAAGAPAPGGSTAEVYERARRRALHQAGFYVHLMWYGIVIGGLFLLNELTSRSFQWWVFPAAGWGIGLASHFCAVYGWSWVHDRVFEPAVKREVQREVNREKEVLRTENQASLDELAATFAHEIRNPIAAARSLVQQMGEDPRSGENVEYAKVALDELARVERSVSHLLKYAKEEAYQFDIVNLATVLDQAVTQMRSKLETSRVEVIRSYLSGPAVRADADKLRQVFANMIDNAIDAMANNAAARRLELIIGGAPGQAVVTIRDNGCGIPADKQGKIFNPFFTTKSEGTGLGLGVAKKVMDAHRGRIEVQSTLGVGTQFILSLPLAERARAWNETQVQARGQSGAVVAADGSSEAASGVAPTPRTSEGWS
ncbi:MAG TPA: ATP-binding protein [Candidatus Binataceae bacterium]|nr:ATP-binding protein [Candidatus Binataceae bacterium]